MYDCSRFSEIRVELFFEWFNEWIQQRSVKRWFSSWERYYSSSYCPDSLITMVSEVPLAPSSPWTRSISMSCHSVQKILSFTEIKRAFLHRAKGKRPMNVIFCILFLVGQWWNFCSWHTLVNQSRQDTSCFGFSLQLPLVPPVLTADIAQWF